MPSAVRGFLLFALAAGVAAGVAGVIVIAVVVLPDTKPMQWDRPHPPTAAQLETLRTAKGADVPTYWFGPAVRGKALSTAKAIEPSSATGTAADNDEATRMFFDYALYCEELDPGSGLACEDKGSVDNGPRQIGFGTYLPRRADCWHAHGVAWVINCKNSYAPRLMTADRIVRFSIPTPTDNAYSRPWREVLRELQRFDNAPGARIPAAKRFTCREAARAGARELRALPATLRPTGCPTQGS